MAYILKTYIPGYRKFPQALTTIKGLGKHQSERICKMAGFAPDMRAKDLRSFHPPLLASIIRQTRLPIKAEVRRIQQLAVTRLVKARTYRGVRHLRRLPVRGQNTHANAKTQRHRPRTPLPATTTPPPDASSAANKGKRR
ncbi:unnamed protein product [Chrysoparadoxa australica]